MLSSCPDINFVGNIEANKVFSTRATFRPTDSPETYCSKASRVWKIHGAIAQGYLRRKLQD